MIHHLFFASKNQHKIKEISAILPLGFSLSGIDKLNIEGELEEPFDKLEQNALHKARFIYKVSGQSAFADDSGLEVFSLNGAPGVHSAHYAGPERDANKNMEKLLAEMTQINDRRASFRTVIAYVSAEGEWLFEGVVEGFILTEKRGQQGFGYDPVFLPENGQKSFAEMHLEEKNQISHRARAFEKFIDFPKKQDNLNS